MERGREMLVSMVVRFATRRAGGDHVVAWPGMVVFYLENVAFWEVGNT